MKVKDLIATEFQMKIEYEDMQKCTATTFCRMNSPFYDGERWAVRLHGTCLNHEGDWEWEPMPSSRTDAFYSRCRFDSLQEALDMYERVVNG